MHLYSLFLLSLALHVSGAICTHPQGTTAAYSLRCVYGFGVLEQVLVWDTITLLARSVTDQYVLQWNNIQKPYTTYGCMLQLCS
jgi:hypothetical protein